MEAADRARAAATCARSGRLGRSPACLLGAGDRAARPGRGDPGDPLDGARAPGAQQAAGGAADRRRGRPGAGGGRRLVPGRQVAAAGAGRVQPAARVRLGRVARAAHAAGRDPRQRRVPAAGAAGERRGARHRQRDRPAVVAGGRAAGGRARDDDRGARALHTQVDLAEVVEATVASFQTVDDRPRAGADARDTGRADGDGRPRPAAPGAGDPGRQRACATRPRAGASTCRPGPTARRRC